MPNWGQHFYHLSQRVGRKWFAILFVVMMCFWLFLGILPKDVPGQYKVVFDAGSTGTRVHVFKFSVPQLRSDQIVLLGIPLFAKYEKGISSFAANPREARLGLQQLLLQAEQVVPESEWATTEVLLMATAGLRLLPPVDAEALLREARWVLNSSKFRVNMVDTIDGELEAKLIFTMASFVAKHSSMAIVDLGGGSVQLAYDGGGKKFPVFLHSWLGYGLVAFRLKALQELVGAAHPCVPEWTPAGSTYHYGDVTVPVVPRSGHDDHLDACVHVLTNALNINHQCRVEHVGFGPVAEPLICGLNGQWLGPSEANSILEWKLFSYIFDLALEEGLVMEGEFEGRLTANDFYRAAKQHCELGSTKRTEWWKCIDLVYVYVLLTRGFKLDPNYSLMVTKKLKYISAAGSEIFLEAAWPMGAAIAAIRQEL